MLGIQVIWLPFSFSSFNLNSFRLGRTFLRKCLTRRMCSPFIVVVTVAAAAAAAAVAAATAVAVVVV